MIDLPRKMLELIYHHGEDGCTNGALWLEFVDIRPDIATHAFRLLIAAKLIKRCPRGWCTTPAGHLALGN